MFFYYPTVIANDTILLVLWNTMETGLDISYRLKRRS